MGKSKPIAIGGHSYDPEQLDLLRTMLDEIWTDLSESQRNQLPRSLIAERLLRATAAGERDRNVLRSYVFDGLKPVADEPSPDARPV